MANIASVVHLEFLIELQIYMLQCLNLLDIVRHPTFEYSDIRFSFFALKCLLFAFVLKVSRLLLRGHKQAFSFAFFVILFH